MFRLLGDATYCYGDVLTPRCLEVLMNGTLMLDFYDVLSKNSSI